MQSTTNNITLNYDKGQPCKHCGKLLPMRTMSFMCNGTPKEVSIGLEPCDCDTAIREREIEQAKEREAIRKADQEKRNAQYERAGIPKKYRRYMHENAPNVAKTVRQGQGFYIYGPNGTEKTTLAMSAGMLLIDAGVRVYAIGSYELMDAMRSRREEKAEVYNRAIECEVLIIDDLGKEASNTPYACERLFAIIDKRDKEERPVIITTNFKLSEIADGLVFGSVGGAIASRLRGSCRQIQRTGDDRRIRDAKEHVA